MIDDKFLDWLKNAKVSELMKYQPRDQNEKYLIEVEIDRRLDKNVPNILDKVFSFLSDLTSDKK